MAEQQQPNDAAAERTVAQFTQSASGLSAGTDRQRRREDRERFRRASLDTPRRYDQPIEDDDDPVRPSGDATLNTKI